ncbi:hypothetical protein SeLEV6574_g06674, partial [Synchytrium endobioticum]
LYVLYRFEMSTIVDFEQLGQSPESPEEMIIIASSESSIQVITLPKMQVLLKQESHSPHIIHSQHVISTRNGLFTSAKSCSTGCNINAITETIPLQKYQDLIAAKEFTQAQKFAVQHQLDIQTLLIAKLSAILESQQIPEYSQCMSWVDSLLKDLEGVQDSDFLVRFCTSVDLPSAKAVYKLLAFASNRVPSMATTLSALHSSIRRLATYQSLSARKSYSSTDIIDGAAWQAFRTADLSTRMIEFARSGDMDAIMIIWRRHYQDILESLVQVLACIPEAQPLPSYLPWLQYEVTPVLSATDSKHAFASWVEQRARAIEIADKKPQQALEVAVLLEHLYGTKELSAPSVDVGLPTPNRYVHDKTAVSGTVKGNEASELVMKLRNLKRLHELHQMTLTLAEYSAMAPTDIAIKLIERVAAPELLDDAVEKHLRPYSATCNLSCDEVLAEYCMDLMDSVAPSHIEAPWEERVLALVPHIHSTEIRSNVVLEVMRRCPVPWSGAVDTLIQETMSSFHRTSFPSDTPRYASELREQCKLMSLRRILLKYGISKFNLSDLGQAKSLLCYILSKTDEVNAMQDGVRLVAAYRHLRKTDAMIVRIRNLCLNGCLDRARRLLLEGREEVMANGDVDKSIDSIDSAIEDHAWRSNVDDESAIPDLDAIIAAKECYIWCEEEIASLAAGSVSRSEERSHFETIAEAGAVLADALHVLLGRTKSTDDVIDAMHCTSEMKAVRSLATEFSIYIDIKTLQSDADKRKILTKAAFKIFKYSSLQPTDFQDVDEVKSKTLSHLYHLAELLGFGRDIVRGMIAEEAAKCGDFQTVLSICHEMFDKFPGPHTAKCLMRVAKFMTLYATEHAHVYSHTDEGKKNHRLTSRIRQLAQQALAVGDEPDISNFLSDFKNFDLQHTVFAQCDAGDYAHVLIQPTSNQSSSSSGQAVITDVDVAALGDSYGASLFTSCFHEIGLVLSTHQAMSQVGNFVTSVVTWGNTDSQNTRGKSKTEHDPLSLGQSLTTYLRSARSLQTAMSCWQQLFELSTRDSGNIGPFNVEEEQEGLLSSVQNLLQQVLSSRYIDQSLAVGYMLYLPLTNAFEAFKGGLTSVATDYSRLQTFASIGEVAGVAWNQRTFVLDCQTLSSNARWWHQFRLLGIPFDDSIFRKSEDGEYQRKLIPLFLERTHLDVTTVLEFARNYRLEDDLVIFEYAKRLLVSKATSSYSDYENGMALILADIENKDKFLNVLLEIVTHVSTYDYERLQYLFSQILTFKSGHQQAEKGRLIIEVLMHYKRYTKPSHQELIEAKSSLWDHETVKDSSNENLLRILPMAKKRLPFHALIKDPWRVLKPELNKETVSRLLPLCLPLGLPEDDFYMEILQNMVQVATIPAEMAKDQITLSLTFGDFKVWLLKLRNPESAVHIAVVIAGKYAGGPERIAAYKYASAQCEKWMKGTLEKDVDSRKRAESAAAKVKMYLAVAETEHQLRCTGLQDLLNYATQPQTLIIQLFTQKSANLVKDSNFDLHGVASDVAARHGLDYERIRSGLIQMGLSEDLSSVAEANSVKSLPSMLLQGKKDTEYMKAEMEVRSRLVALLSYGTIEKSVQLLMNYAYQQSSKILTISRVRALSVLFTIASPSILAKCNIDSNSTAEHLRILLYLCDFEYLRIVLHIKEFQICDKKALAQTLWMNHNKDPLAVELICNVCCDFLVNDQVLWENLLQRLAEFSQFEYGLKALEFVMTAPELAQIASLPQLVSCVILGYLKQTLSPQDAIIKLGRIARLLYTCPFVSLMEERPLVDALASVLSNAAQPQVVHRALSAMYTLPRTVNTRDKIKDIMDKLPSECLLPLLVDMGNGMDLNFVKDEVKKLIYAQINTRGCFGIILRTSHLASFGRYLIEQDQIDQAMIFAVSALRRPRIASTLLKLYYSARGSMGKDAPRELLTMYLESHDLDKTSRQVLLEAFGADDADVDGDEMDAGQISDDESRINNEADDNFQP